MRNNLLSPLGLALRERRHDRKLTQPQLAQRLGRSTPRISELEKELLADRIGKDRLGLLVEICDALNLVPMLVPAEKAQAVRRSIAGGSSTSSTASGRVFDDVFVDLSDDEDEG